MKAAKANELPLAVVCCKVLKVPFGGRNASGLEEFHSRVHVLMSADQSPHVVWEWGVLN
jgi:hypothetical protein